MSSANNHRKRSHRSEGNRSSAFNARRRRMYSNPAYQKKNGFFARLFSGIRRNTLPEGRKKVQSNDNV